MTRPSDAIVTVPVSGGTPVTLAESANTAINIAVGPGGVYFSDLQDVMSVPLAGGAVTTIVSGTNVAGLAVDATSLYWTGLDGMVKAPLGGGTPVTLDGASRAPPIALHDGLIYWGQSDSLWSIPVNGGAQSSVWTLSGSDGTGSAEGIAFDTKAVYETFVGGFSVVARVPLDGSAAVTLASTGEAIFRSIAVDNANVYYAFYDSRPISAHPSCGAILRVPIGGGAPLMVAAGPVSSIALDSENVYWSQTPQCPDGTRVASGIYKVAKP